MRYLQVPRSTDWEILAVNNNCSDDTDAVIQRYTEHLPIRRLWEPRPGKSNAANLAVREARGELILWTDDDVLVDSGWLKAYVEAARAFPDVSFFGGPIAPWFESEPPAWLARHLPLISTCFAMQTPFEEPYMPVCAPRHPFGANMAMRRECFEDCSFDIRLGPVGNTNYQHEETALLQTCLDRGRKGLWVREARVQHFIPKARITEGYVWRFNCCSGRTLVRRGEVSQGKEIFGVPRGLVRKYVVNLVVSTLLSPTKNVRWLRALTMAAVCRGMIEELRDQGIAAGRDEKRRASRRDEATVRLNM